MAIPIDDDDVDEAGGSVAFALTVPNNRNHRYTIDPGADLLFNIADDDVTISVADADGNESTGQLIFTVTLAAENPETVTVAYRTSDHTAGTDRATAGTDYTAITTAQTLTFTPGQTSRQITVTIADDGPGDSGETFLLVLSDPSPADATLADAQAIGTIRERPALSISASNTSVTEGESITFTITLSHRDETTQGPVPVPVTVTADSSLITVLDAPNQATIASGETTTSFNIRIGENNRHEIDDDLGNVIATIANPDESRPFLPTAALPSALRLPPSPSPMPMTPLLSPSPPAEV